MIREFFDNNNCIKADPHILSKVIHPEAKSPCKSAIHYPRYIILSKHKQIIPKKKIVALLLIRVVKKGDQVSVDQRRETCWPRILELSKQTRSRMSPQILPPWHSPTTHEC